MKRTLLLLVFSIVGHWITAQTSGGPDAYGYTWKNSSHTTNPPSYSWVDITSIGTQVTGLADDNVVGPFSVPAGFQFYWYPITQFWIGSNGYVSFNGANIASPFPSSIPLSSGANDWFAPLLSDLNFSGSSNPAQCWYYASNDSLIITYINTPYWVLTSPGYSGSNTFQVIFSSIDNSITFNYKSMSSGTVTLPLDNAVGIENNTGVLGLQTLIDIVPGNLSTIKYYYPTTVTYAVKDGGINWNNNPLNAGYFIPVSNTPINLKCNVKNFGNQSIGSFTVTDTIYAGNNALSNGSASINALQPGDDTTIVFSNMFYAQWPDIYKFSTRVQGITGDLVPVNNRKTQKIISVKVTDSLYTLDYSDGFPDGAGLSWNGGNGGIAVYIQPPVYPVKIEASRFHIGANAITPVGYSAMIFDDNGPNGSPGTLLDSVYISPSNVLVGSYDIIATIDTALYITDGGIYLTWYMAGADITLSRDLTPPFSARSFEILGTAWADYRSKLTEDFLMGIVVSKAPTPETNFSFSDSLAPTIYFSDATNNNPTAWLWEFDENNDTSNLQNPSYTYTTNGTYNVCLTATNWLGSHKKCRSVTISNIGLMEINTLEQLFVYPNPTNNKSYIDIPQTIDVKEVALEIYTVYGQRENIDITSEDHRLTLHTNELKTGVYLFKLTTTEKDDLLIFGKFIVQ